MIFYIIYPWTGYIWCRIVNVEDPASHSRCPTACGDTGGARCSVVGTGHIWWLIVIVNVEDPESHSRCPTRVNKDG